MGCGVVSGEVVIAGVSHSVSPSPAFSEAETVELASPGPGRMAVSPLVLI